MSAFELNVVFMSVFAHFDWSKCDEQCEEIGSPSVSDDEASHDSSEEGQEVEKDDKISVVSMAISELDSCD